MRRKLHSYIGERRPYQSKCQSLPTSNHRRFYRATCLLLGSAQERPRQEWLQVETYSKVTRPRKSQALLLYPPIQLLTLIVDALEEQDIAIINIPNAFIQTRVQDAKDRVIIRITGVIVDWLVKAALKVYAKYVAVNSRKEKSLLVECVNAIYRTMLAGL